MNVPACEIHPTGRADLEGIRALWADGEVMKFVGFPGGLQRSPEEMETWERGKHSETAEEKETAV